MKKILSAVLCACIAVISSCKAGPIELGKPDIAKPFSAEAQIDFGNNSCKAQLRRLTDNSWELCVTEPFSLEGLIVKLKDGETSVSMYGLEGEADFSEEAVSVAKLITEALDAAVNGTISESNGSTVISGSSDNSAYSLTLDDSSHPEQLTLTGRGITVKMSEFKELPVSEQTSPEEVQQTKAPETEQTPQTAYENDVISIE